MPSTTATGSVQRRQRPDDEGRADALQRLHQHVVAGWSVPNGGSGPSTTQPAAAEHADGRREREPGDQPGYLVRFVPRRSGPCRHRSARRGAGSAAIQQREQHGAGGEAAHQPVATRRHIAEPSGRARECARRASGAARRAAPCRRSSAILSEPTKASGLEVGGFARLPVAAARRRAPIEPCLVRLLPPVHRNRRRQADRKCTLSPASATGCGERRIQGEPRPHHQHGFRQVAARGWAGAGRKTARRRNKTATQHPDGDVVRWRTNGHGRQADGPAGRVGPGVAMSIRMEETMASEPDEDHAAHDGEVLLADGLDGVRPRPGCRRSNTSEPGKT